jgi:hypothetical protein
MNLGAGRVGRIDVEFLSPPRTLGQRPAGPAE